MLQYNIKTNLTEMEFKYTRRNRPSQNGVQWNDLASVKWLPFLEHDNEPTERSHMDQIFFSVKSAGLI
jgi:hypothetical protein